jgi:hypothetical protein
MYPVGKNRFAVCPEAFGNFAGGTFWIGENDFAPGGTKAVDGSIIKRINLVFDVELPDAVSLLIAAYE